MSTCARPAFNPAAWAESKPIALLVKATTVAKIRREFIAGGCPKNSKIPRHRRAPRWALCRNWVIFDEVVRQVRDQMYTVRAKVCAKGLGIGALGTDSSLRLPRSGYAHKSSR